MEATVRRSAQLSAVLNGVMLASQVRDQLRLVPMWERLGPEEFRTWFRRHAVRSARWHAPLLLLGLSAAAAAAGRSGRSAGGSTFLRLALVGVALHGGQVEVAVDHDHLGRAETCGKPIGAYEPS